MVRERLPAEIFYNFIYFVSLYNPYMHSFTVGILSLTAPPTDFDLHPEGLLVLLDLMKSGSRLAIA